MSIDLAAILDRHNADSARFKRSGMQDRDSVLLQSHRDRADLLCEVARLTKSPRAAPFPTAADPLGQRPPELTIPWSAWDWLMGQGPDDQGVWFGDGMHEPPRGAFWWRNVFRKLCGLSIDGSDLPRPDQLGPDWREQLAAINRKEAGLPRHGAELNKSHHEPASQRLRGDL